MNGICIIVPYFGSKWPDYFPFYCHSLKNNPFLDVLLFTDIEEKIPYKPENLIVRKMDLQGLKSLISQKTGIRPNFSGTRKLCDFKPAYGHIFENEISEYDFWGFGDIDVIYGNLSKFITGEILNRHDLITYREDWISGAFTLIRNNETMQLLYRRSADYLEILQSEKHFAFDECINKYEKLRDRQDVLTIAGDYQCFTYVCYKAQQEGLIKIFAREYIKESLPFDEILTYTNGAVLGSVHKHYALYHLVTEKFFPAYHIPRWNVFPQEFYFTTTGIYSHLGFHYSLLSKFRKAEAFLSGIKRRIGDSLNYRLGRNRT